MYILYCAMYVLSSDFLIALKIIDATLIYSRGRDANCGGCSQKFLQKRQKTWGGDAKLCRTRANFLKLRITFLLTRSSFCDIIPGRVRGYLSFLYLRVVFALGVARPRGAYVKNIVYLLLARVGARAGATPLKPFVYKGFGTNRFLVLLVWGYYPIGKSVRAS